MQLCESHELLDNHVDYCYLQAILILNLQTLVRNDVGGAAGLFRPSLELSIATQFPPSDPNSTAIATATYSWVHRGGSVDLETPTEDEISRPQPPVQS